MGFKLGTYQPEIVFNPLFTSSQTSSLISWMHTGWRTRLVNLRNFTLDIFSENLLPSEDVQDGGLMDGGFTRGFSQQHNRCQAVCGTQFIHTGKTV